MCMNSFSNTEMFILKIMVIKNGFKNIDVTIDLYSILQMNVFI
jgi:hypothetical protein